MARLLDIGHTQALQVDETPITVRPLTASCWFKCTDEFINSQTVWALVDSTSNDEFFTVRLMGGHPGDPVRSVSGDGGFETIVEAMLGYTANTWHHVAVTYAADKTDTIWLDGANKNSIINGQVPTGLNRLSLGRFGGVSPKFYYDGAIGDISFWNIALTEEQIVALSQGAPPEIIRPDKLASYHRLLFGDGDREYRGKASLKFTAINNPTWSNPNPLTRGPSRAIVITKPRAVTSSSQTSSTLSSSTASSSTVSSSTVSSLSSPSSVLGRIAAIERSASTRITLRWESTIFNETIYGTPASVEFGPHRMIAGILGSGIGMRQANRCIQVHKTITAGNTLDIDLHDFANVDVGAGLGNDGLGAPMNLEEIVAISIRYDSGDGRLEVMPTLPFHGVEWMPKLTVINGGALKDSGFLFLYAENTDALPIVDGDKHILRLGASGGSVTFDLIVLGRHDDDDSSSSQSNSSSRSASTASSTTASSYTSSSLSESTSSSTPSSESNPPRVTFLIAKALQYNTISLIWNEPQFVNQAWYELETSKDAGTTWMVYCMFPHGTSQAVLAGFDASSTYHFRMRSVNPTFPDWSYSAYSNTTNANTPAYAAADHVINSQSDWNSLMAAGVTQGEIIEINPAVTINSTTLPIPAQGSGSQGSGFVTVRSASYQSLTGYDLRIHPSHAANMPVIRTNTQNPAMVINQGNHHWTFEGIEFVSDQPDTIQVESLIDFRRTAGGSFISLFEIPHDIQFHRCYFRSPVPSVAGTQTTAGINVRCSNFVAKDCYFDEFSGNASTTRALTINQGVSISIVNNHIEGSGYNVLVGGPLNNINNHNPTRILLSRNHFWKDPAWRDDLAGWDGADRTVRGHVLIEAAQHLLARDNIFDHQWDTEDINGGYSICVCPNTDTASHVMISNVHFTHNIMRKVAQNILITGGDAISTLGSAPKNIQVRHTLAIDSKWAGLYGNFVTVRVADDFQVPRPEDLLISHNTAVSDAVDLLMFCGLESIASAELWDGKTVRGRLVIKDNLFHYGQWGLILFGDGLGSDALTHFADYPNWRVDWQKNLQIGEAPENDATLYPNQLFAADDNAVGFEDSYRDDFRLASGSAFKMLASDGTDPGADINAVLDRASHAADGDWTDVLSSSSSTSSMSTMTSSTASSASSSSLSSSSFSSPSSESSSSTSSSISTPSFGSTQSSVSTSSTLSSSTLSTSSSISSTLSSVSTSSTASSPSSLSVAESASSMSSSTLSTLSTSSTLSSSTLSSSCTASSVSSSTLSTLSSSTLSSSTSTVSSSTVSGVEMWAASFNSANQEYLQKDQADVLSFPLTICTWVKTTANAATFVWIGQKESNLNYFSIRMSSGIAIATQSTGGSSSSPGSLTMNDGAWHFLAAKFEDATSRTIYLDDETPIKDTGNLAFPSGINRTSIGRYGGLNPGDYLTGAVDQTFVFEDALSEAQIGWIRDNTASYQDLVTSMDANNPGVSNLLNSWHLDEASGTREDEHGTCDLADNNTVTRETGTVITD